VAYPSLKITFLGTGTSSGVPMIGCSCAVCTSTDKKDTRLRSSILVQSATTTVVVDSGPDFRYQMLRAGVKHLDAIIFTHSHKDHVAGLDDIRAFNFFSQKPMDVYATEMTQQVLMREFPYAFTDTRYPGLPEINLNHITNEPFTIGDITIIPVEVWHLKMPVLGFRFGGFSYVTDANRIEPDELQKLRDGDVLVLNALRKEKHVSHFTLGEATELGRLLNNKQTYFTHISHQLGRHADINKELPEGFQLAYDGLVIQL
jgi:phosphoribosyl 1,2-cyclic phosphate phosphodiesterase